MTLICPLRELSWFPLRLISIFVKFVRTLHECACREANYPARESCYNESRKLILYILHTSNVIVARVYATLTISPEPTVMINYVRKQTTHESSHANFT